MLIFGAAMVGIMVWRPRGLIARREPSLRLQRRARGVSGAARRRCSGRASDHALRRPRGRRRSFLRRAAPRDHRDHRPERRRQDHGVQLPHRLLPAERRAAGAAPAASATFLLERMDGFRIAREAGVARTFQNIRLFAGMTVLENLIVAQHNRLMRASLYSVGGLVGLPIYRRAEAAAVTKARRLARPHRPHRSRRRRRPAACPMARSGGSRSRAPCAPIRRCCASTSRRPGSIRANRRSSTLLLRDIRDEHGIGILLIEHDMGVVMGISDHIVVLDYGRKIADGTPDRGAQRSRGDQGLSRRGRGGGPAAGDRARPRQRGINGAAHRHRRPHLLRQYRGAAKASISRSAAARSSR